MELDVFKMTPKVSNALKIAFVKRKKWLAVFILLLSAGESVVSIVVSRTYVVLRQRAYCPASSKIHLDKFCTYEIRATNATDFVVRMSIMLKKVAPANMIFNECVSR